jgi:hypothetical protein
MRPPECRTKPRNVPIAPKKAVTMHAAALAKNASSKSMFNYSSELIPERLFSRTALWVFKKRKRRRVAGRGHPRPAPEEPSMIVSHHSARAAQRPATNSY